MNGGSCTDGIDSFACSCVASYTGSMCQTDVNECSIDTSLCSNGRCVNLDGSYTCVCNAGFTLVNANSCNALPSSLSTSQVNVQITGQSLNGQTLTYTPELTNRSSAKFMEYEVAFCYIFSQYVREQLGSQLVDANCIVLSFRQGSVVGDVQVELAAESQSVADGLAVSLSALSTNIDQNLSANGQTLVASISIVSTPSSSPSVSSPPKSNLTVVGSAVGAIVVIVIVIVLIIIFYKRRSNESASTKSRGKESDSSPQYENPVFDQSQTDVHTFQDHTYHDLNGDAQGYEIPTGPHPYKDINTDDQSYDYIADPHTYLDFNTVAQGYDDIADPNTNQDLNTDAHGYDDIADPHTYLDLNSDA
eukprot:XP_011670717.1 PREDICTED: protein HEG-like [Strongylocentrotus purpuratus]